MKTLQKLTFLAAFAFGSLAYGQTALTQTTLSGALTAGSRTIPLTSCTGISAPNTSGGGSFLYIDRELVTVISVSSTSPCFVQAGPRGSAGTKAFAHKTGTSVFIGPGLAFISYDLSGSCTAGSGNFTYAPVINVQNGDEYLCSSVSSTVVSGFQNSTYYAPIAPTTAVASAAGLITPSGPLFHVTGTAAITGFNIPVGFNVLGGGGQPAFCIVPDGAFTVTTANNISKASTAVVGQTMCFTYDPNSTKFSPSY